jgi:hypothetical protein
MRHVLLALSLALGFAAAARAEKVDCEPARCAVQAAIASECSCPEATNHGRYVSCVAHVVRRLAANGTIPITCKGKVTRCAARSTCGKPDFVTCYTPTDTCDLTTLKCVESPELSCATDLDCGSVCKVRRAESCALRGGTAGTASSCCAACGS